MKNDRKIVFLAGFLFSIPIALTSYINSSFLKTYVSVNDISLLYVIASIITIFGFLKMPRLLNRLGNQLTAFFLSLSIFISLILLALGSNEFIVVLAFFLYFIASNLIIASLDIFIEDFSKSSSIGKFRGLYLMIINSAWVIAQMVSGSIINKSSFRGIYLFAAGFMILVATIFILFLHDFKDPKYKKVSIKKTLQFFTENKHASKIYLINFILKFFYVWMIIYTPIYLNEYLHFGWGQIGIIFTIMLIPFVLVDFPLGKMSDKMGEKKILIWGFIISIISTLCIPLTIKNDLWVWALIMFGTRTGAAVIEVMSESYFFKIINEENSDAISFFRNDYPLAYVIAPLLAIPILFLVPSFKYLFYILGAILLCGLFVALRLEDVK